MPIGLTDYIIPKNEAFVGMVRAQDVKGSDDDGGTLPAACLPDAIVVGDADDTETPSAYFGVGDDGDGMLYALAAGTVYLDNRTVDADLILRINDNGTLKDALKIHGATANLIPIGNIQFATNLRGFKDSSSNYTLIFQAAENAVNYTKLTNAATGFAPSFYAAGSDSNIDLDLWGKGTGVVKADGSPVVCDDDLINSSAGAGDAGKPIKLDAGGHIDATMINDADVDHGSVGGLSDDDHSQYALLDGRSEGQTLTGGTDSGDKLILKASSHATPGAVEIGDEGDTILGATGQSSPTVVKPSVDEMIDLGTDSLRFRDLYATRPHVPVSEASFTDPPTDAELDSAFGAPATLGDGFCGLIDSGGSGTHVRDVRCNGSKWFYGAKLTEAGV